MDALVEKLNRCKRKWVKMERAGAELNRKLQEYYDSQDAGLVLVGRFVYSFNAEDCTPEESEIYELFEKWDKKTGKFGDAVENLAQALNCISVEKDLGVGTMYRVISKSNYNDYVDVYSLHELVEVLADKVYDTLIPLTQEDDDD